MLLKVITKIIAQRLKKVLSRLVNEVQGAFVESRLMQHNIFLCQELLSNYGRHGIAPRCALKVNIQKAYDSVHWEFLEAVLRGMGFPAQFIQWVMLCVTTPKYSIVINGALEGFFEGKRGIRQGDPLSPLPSCLLSVWRF